MAGLPCAPEHTEPIGSTPLPDQHVLPSPGSEPLPPVGDASHWSSAPRRGYIMVHHHGWSGTDSSPPCHAYSVPGSHYYDFCIARNGSICNTGTWSWTNGGHAGPCNPQYIGVMLQGCFGGGSCGPSDASLPSFSQLCSLAYISLHLQTPAFVSRHQPHRVCTCGTDCPGTNLWSGCGWNATGNNLMNQMLNYRSNLARGCNCEGTFCPQ